ncbi:MAG: hypothetical protein HY819_15030 [Acidobacteria bacterium]|nr:hypothetical protein [Acidobacteriota bacterium]
MSQNDEDLMIRLRARLEEEKRKSPLEKARDFMQTYVADNYWDDIQKEVEHMIKINPITIIWGLEGIEDLLATPPQEEGVLANLVTYDGGWMLDEYNDEHAKVWLKELSEFIRKVMGDKQPPRSS